MKCVPRSTREIASSNENCDLMKSDFNFEDANFILSACVLRPIETGRNLCSAERKLVSRTFCFISKGRTEKYIPLKRQYGTKIVSSNRCCLGGK